MGSWIADLMLEAAPLVIGQFNDLCDIKNLVKKNVDGQMVEDTALSTTVSNIKCTYEPWRMHSDPTLHMPLSEVDSASVTHKILMEATAATLAIKQNYIITIHARDGRPALLFEQPIRLDESLSPLIIVAAILRNQ